MKRFVVIFIERDPVARDVHEEITPVGEAVVHLLQGMNDEVDRRLERLVDRKLADEPVFELAPEIDLLGETLIIDDDEKVEVGAVALGGVRPIEPAAAGPDERRGGKAG